MRRGGSAAGCQSLGKSSRLSSAEVIVDFNVIGLAGNRSDVLPFRQRFQGCPSEADTPLPIDPNAVLARPTAERLEPIRRRVAEVIEAYRRPQLGQSHDRFLRARLERPHSLAGEEIGCRAIAALPYRHLGCYVLRDA